MTKITNDLATRLLAQENLMINRAPVKTASFNVLHRILTLPMWQNMTPEIEEMLKAHEVGHALYTDESIFAEHQTKNPKLPFGYLNILEDARIEKLMKRKYPGLRKVFTQGYVELNNRDFFGLMGKPRKLQLIDRINLWFKVGYASGVKFSVAEKYLVEKAEKMETIGDVVDLAKTVYAFSLREKQKALDALKSSADYKKLKEEEKKDIEEDLELEALMDEDEKFFDDDDWSSSPPEYTEPDEDTPEEDLEQVKVRSNETAAGDSYEADVDGETLDTDLSNEDLKELESVTNKAFDEKLATAADTSTEYVYLGLPDTSKMNAKVDYKTVVRETNALLDGKKQQFHITSYYKEYEDFKVENSRVVNYLYKEFEMKKAASAYKRTSTAKTGVLDVAKIASYRIREDLFKQITITKDGQKHGMLFTIDWSGSMNEYLHETVKQVISLATFCYRAKIPFEVYAFSDNVDGGSRYDDYRGSIDLDSTYDKDKFVIDQRFQMLEFFSHRMTVSEFNTMCRNLFVMSRSDDARQWVPSRDKDMQNVALYSHPAKYQLNGTPLNEAMVWFYNYCGEFKRNNQVEKLTLIKLTDGDAHGFQRYITDRNDRGAWDSRYIERTRYAYNEVERQHVRYKIETLLQDDVTKKTYNYTPEDATNIICKMIQDRYEAAVVGYHVVGSGRRELTYTLQRYRIADEKTAREALAIDIRKGFNEDMFFPVQMAGHTEMFFLPNTIRVKDETLEEAMGNLTANQIAKKFSKHVGGKKTSRILLNRFVQAVA